MINQISNLGAKSINTVQEIGRTAIFLVNVLFRRPKIKRIFPEIISQIYFVGVLSFLIIVVSALFIGMVVGLQGFNTLEKFGADSQLGQLLALSITRELGPVITALLFAGRAGSALTAEIGLMKTTEQLSSMEMMGVDPLWRVIYPRFWAGLISMPVLSLIFCAVAVYGGFFVGVHWLGVDGGSFWSNMQSAVNFQSDVISGILKSVVFGFVVIWIAVYQGVSSQPTALGVSQATTKTVVYASLAVLGLDFILTAMMIGGW
jgi:phospholipid/cholesterol/gamma-HCH transport system permease protein